MTVLFKDVSRESGIAAHPGKSFGAVATDVNNDGLMDLFVANDTMPNFLFVNKGGGKFEEIGLSAGVAYGEAGRPRSGMGVDAADYRRRWLAGSFRRQYRSRIFQSLSQ